MSQEHRCGRCRHFKRMPNNGPYAGKCFASLPFWAVERLEPNDGRSVLRCDGGTCEVFKSRNQQPQTSEATDGKAIVD